MTRSLTKLKPRQGYPVRETDFLLARNHRLCVCAVKRRLPFSYTSAGAFRWPTRPGRPAWNRPPRFFAGSPRRRSRRSWWPALPLPASPYSPSATFMSEGAFFWDSGLLAFLLSEQDPRLPTPQILAGRVFFATHVTPVFVAVFADQTPVAGHEPTIFCRVRRPLSRFALASVSSGCCIRVSVCADSSGWLLLQLSGFSAGSR